MAYNVELLGISNLFATIAEEFGLDVSKNDLLEFTKSLGDHTSNNSLDGNEIDAYKIISYGGISLCKKYQLTDPKYAKKLLLTTITTLNVVLSKEVNKKFQTEFLQNITKAVFASCKKPDTGINKHGLYFTFKGAMKIAKN